MGLLPDCTVIVIVVAGDCRITVIGFDGDSVVAARDVRVPTEEIQRRASAQRDCIGNALHRVAVADIRGAAEGKRRAGIRRQCFAVARDGRISAGQKRIYAVGRVKLPPVPPNT